MCAQLRRQFMWCQRDGRAAPGRIA
jgi:hypothetical protein